MRRCEEQFHYLVQNAPDIVTILGADFSVRYANSSVERVLGYRREEFIGTKVFKYLASKESKKAFDGLIEELEDPGRGPTFIEFGMRHADGSSRRLEAFGADLLGDDPQVGRMALYARDVTERRALEDELARRVLYDPLTGLLNRAYSRTGSSKPWLVPSGVKNPLRCSSWIWTTSRPSTMASDTIWGIEYS